MIELGKAKRQVIEAICRDSLEVLILGAMEGSIGRVWVPSLDNPPYCFIQVGDFSYLIGIAPVGKDVLELKTQIYECHQHGCQPGVITATDERWQEWLEEHFAGEYRKITRYAFKKDAYCFDRQILTKYKNQIPAGMCLKAIDENLYHQALKNDWSKALCNNFEDAAHFLTEGLGFVILQGKTIVAGCSAYGVSAHKVEVEVITRKDYRRQGLALACSAAFVLECLERQVIPDWDAANQQSVSLAEKLGYLFEREYEVYQLIMGDHEEGL